MLPTAHHNNNNNNSGSRSKFEDEPLAPPPEIKSKFPDFSVCDPDKCGNHTIPGVNPEARVDCHKCKATSASRKMHALPCGHHLCRDDLEEMAAEAVTRIQDVPIGSPLWAARHQYKKIEDEMVRMVLDGADEGARGLQRRRVDAQVAVLCGLVGLACCGQPAMVLRNHMACLEPAVARGLWTLGPFLTGDPAARSRRCGWPDCGRYLPPAYTWLDRGVDDAYAQRWHCVVCEGNSKLQSNGRFQPAR